MQTTVSAQLNLAIVYDENEGILDSTPAISITIRDLFKSQATPVLLTGNLALRLGILATPRHELVPFIENRGALALTEKAQLKQCKLLNSEYAVLKNRAEKSLGVENFSMHPSKEFPKTTLDQAQTHLVLLAEQEQVCRDITCSSHNIFCGYGGLLDYKRLYINDINLEKWHVYAVKQTTQHLMLFIPDAYATAHDAKTEHGIDVEKIGFDKKTLVKIETVDLAQKAANYEFNSKTIASSIKSIFAIPHNPVTADHWNIFIAGHGESPEANIPPIQLLLKTTTMMAGMPSREFLKLMDFWALLPTNIVVYLTCFGGGTTAKAIEQLFSIASTVTTQKTKSDYHAPIVISLASGEQTTQAHSTDYKSFFDSLGKMFSSKPKTQEEQQEDLKKMVKKITTDKPLILFPRQTLPALAVEHTFVTEETGKIREESTLDATFKLAVIEGKKRSEGQFKYLIEPDYTLSTDPDGSTKISSLPTALKDIKFTDREIIFNKPDTYIALETSTVTKPLNFIATNSLKFDIRTTAEHLTFSSISFSHVQLNAFLAQTFMYYGKPLHIIIASCTAQNTTPPVIRDASKSVTITDVELFTLPLSAAPYRGNVLFTYQKHLFVFNLIQNKDQVNLQFFYKISLPTTKDAQGATRSTIIKSLTFNNQLALLILKQDTDAIVRWFIQPIAPSERIEQVLDSIPPFLLESMLSVLVADKEALSYMDITQEQFNNIIEKLDYMASKNIGVKYLAAFDIQQPRKTTASSSRVTEING
jgi:hypothetical protein